jgi:hypothetical protein
MKNKNILNIREILKRVDSLKDLETSPSSELGYTLNEDQEDIDNVLGAGKPCNTNFAD